jgi:hypothetical protein
MSVIMANNLMSPLDLNPMAYANTVVALLVIILGIYYFLKGRKVDKWMMLINVLSGFWVLVAYIAIFIDAFVVDFLSPAQITCYVIRPALFVLLSTKLANIIRLGRRDA